MTHNMLSPLQESVIEALERSAFERSRSAGEMPHVGPGTYEQVLPEALRATVHNSWHAIVEPVWASIIAPHLDIVETRGVEQAAVLRGRVEMFITDLRARGEHTVAAELQVIIDTPMED